MGNILFYNTKTSEHQHLDLPPSHESQPHLMQIEAWLTNSDGEALSTFVSLVAPIAKYKVELKAEAAHGLTYENCRAHGINPHTIVLLLNEMVDDVSLIVAHNQVSNNKTIQTFCYSLLNDPITRMAIGGEALEEFNSHIVDLNKKFSSDTSTHCTMQALNSSFEIPDEYNKDKWSTIQKAYRRFFTKEFDNTLPDVIACKDVYFAITQHLS